MHVHAHGLTRRRKVRRHRPDGRGAHDSAVLARERAAIRAVVGTSGRLRCMLESAAPKSAAAPLGSPAAFSIRFTMAQKVARIKEELSLDPSLPLAKAVAEANVAMGIEGQGTLAQQVDYLLTELGVL